MAKTNLQNFHVDESFETLNRTAPAWVSQPRRLHTTIDDDQLRNCGLAVIGVAKRPRYWSGQFQDDSNDSSLDLWLVKSPVNDDIDQALYNHAWLPIVEGRVRDLLELSVEEELKFDSESASAALAFLQNTPSIRQPSTFLVDGNIRLVWDNEIGEQVGLQFRGRSRVQYVLFQRDGNELDPMMGTKSVESIYELLGRQNALSIMASE